MALRDTWHRALVYFGLAEDHYEDEEYYEPETAPEPAIEAEPVPRRSRESASTRRASRRRRRDDIDDIFAEDSSRAGSRDLRSAGNGGADLQVHLVVPGNFNDAQELADHFKRSVPVILNMQTTEPELSKRLIDFASGLTYALNGGMQRIAEKVFLITPRNVEVSAEERARMIEKGFFNQS
jgi:cell division inhibitor SepF